MSILIKYNNIFRKLKYITQTKITLIGPIVKEEFGNTLKYTHRHTHKHMSYGVYNIDLIDACLTCSD